MSAERSLFGIELKGDGVMSEEIEGVIGTVLVDCPQRNALEFVSFLRGNGMVFERGKGYWEDKFYWLIKFKEEYVCFLLIGGEETRDGSWAFWSDDSGSNWFEDFPLDESLKEIAWKNVDFCANCGGECSPGKGKVIFDRGFNNVCRTVFKFVNPDDGELACMKELVRMRTAKLC